jgi:6-pyruvoyltetrahydropterin/6-carboxytetrahydropterin synthase
MFQITVESRFSAAHAIRINGALEPLHGHDWHITATIEGDTLDRDGLLCDFHTIEGALHEITDRFHNRSLNDLDPFRIATQAGALNPSAENVALHIARELARAIDEALAPSARLVSVRTTEAPGCAATCFLPHPARSPAR